MESPNLQQIGKVLTRGKNTGRRKKGVIRQLMKAGAFLCNTNPEGKATSKGRARTGVKLPARRLATADEALHLTH